MFHFMSRSCVITFGVKNSKFTAIIKCVYWGRPLHRTAVTLGDRVIIITDKVLIKRLLLASVIMFPVYVAH